MRNDVFERMKFLVNEDIKPNFSQIGRQYGVDRRTAKAAYDRAKSNQKVTKRKVKKPSKLDGFEETIKRKYEAGCTAKAIYYFIQKKGYTGGYTLVKTFCRNHKQEEIKKATIRVTHTMGLSAQVDWKEQLKFHDQFGKLHTFNIFLYVLPYSKLKFLSLTLDKNQDTLFKMLSLAFKFTGGVPQEIWFDNMATVVNHDQSYQGHPKFNERFLSFSKDVGFKPIACRPYRPQTKGSVEALARTTSRLKPYDGEFKTLKELDEIVDEIRDDLNHEKSQSTDKIPLELWQKEKECLNPLNDSIDRYFNSVQTRKVSKDSMIMFRKNQYSVNPKYIGKEVEIKLGADENTIHIYFSGVEISSHCLTDQPFNYHREDYQEILESDLYKDQPEKVEKFMSDNLDAYDNL
ncbi:MAG: IS21 family transposase [Clostridia bacterium]|nr:IS21 family transposase [Clostridia bacterium]